MCKMGFYSLALSTARRAKRIIDLSEPPKNPISTKVLATVLALFVIALIGGALITYYLGAFTTPVIRAATSPALHIAYLEHTGPYDEIDPFIEKVAEELKKANTRAGTPFALLLDDIGKTPRSQLRAKVGYIINAGDFVPGGLHEETLPPRDVVLATFEGSPLVGSYKSYEAMKDWAVFHGYGLRLPALEIFHSNGVLEYQLGIAKE